MKPVRHRASSDRNRPQSGAVAEDRNPGPFFAALKRFLAGMTGEVTGAGLPSRVEARVGDIIEHLEAGAAGRSPPGCERWFLSTAFLQYAVTKSGVFQNNWLATLGSGNHGADCWKRTSANLVGLWANANDEVIYFVATRDADGQPLNGANDYVLWFSAASRPDAVVNAYWSVILVDVPDYRVVKNPLNRFNFNSDSGLKSEADGSLKILFAAKPNPAVPESNWLPSAPGKGFSLTLRTYVPKDLVKRGEWFPPALKRLK